MIILNQFPFTENDDEANIFIENFIHNAIKRFLSEIIHTFENKHYVFNGIHEIDYYPEMLYEYFPSNFRNYDVSHLLYIMKGLYSLLNSDNTWVPTLIMEYVMSCVIEKGINEYEWTIETAKEEYEEKYGIKCDDPVELLSKVYWVPEFRKENQDKILNIPFSKKTYNKLVKAFAENAYEYGYCDTKKQAREYSKDIIDNVWHFSSEWLEWCFWDSDYTLLDMMTISQVRQIPFPDIISQNPSDDSFYLPSDWENSKDFRFINHGPRDDLAQHSSDPYKIHS